MKSKNIAFILNALIVILLSYYILTPPEFKGEATNIEHHTQNVYKAQIETAFFSDLLYTTEVNFDNTLLQAWQNGTVLNFSHYILSNEPTYTPSEASFYNQDDILYFTLAEKNSDINSLKITYLFSTRPNSVFFSIFIISCISLLFFYLNLKKNTKDALDIFLFTPEYKEFNTKQDKIDISFFFALTLMAALLFLFQSNARWSIYEDTYSYLITSYVDPWYSFRPFGYKIFMDFFEFGTNIEGFSADTVEGLYEVYQNDPAKDQAFQRVFYAQYILTALSVATLCLALTTVLPLAWSFFIPFITFLIAPILYINVIAPESLSTTLTIFAIAFLIFYTSSKKLLFLLLAVIISVYAFLLKPGLIFLIAITGIIIIYELIANLKNKCKAVTFFTLGCCLFIGLIFFPTYLYIKGGIVTMGQLSYITKGGEVWAFADASHAKFIESEDLRKVYLIILEKKAELDKTINPILFPKGKENYSTQYSFVRAFNSYTPIYVKEVGDYIKSKNKLLNYVELYKEAEKIYGPIRPEILSKRLVLYKENLFSCFGVIHGLDINSTLLGKINSGSPVRSYIFPIIFCVLIVSFVLGTAKLRFALTIPFSVHLLNILAMSIGHTPLVRYVAITEFGVLLSFFIGLCIIFKAIRHKVSTV